MHNRSTDVRCHRCREVMVLYVPGDDYCQPCKREIRAREDADARRVQRFAVAKDLGAGDSAA